ncbi:hypothetical protein PCE31107_00452 [Pandoraea cepalis]|uniref:Uncharacterized protein n=1 Tax=Pandoraea cepalis TaxID=2508294 RepID=A0A5E4RWZ1_9BURK|nr:hypothetical protein PCE31107_00452 [Pandoraea cepalis]
MSGMNDVSGLRHADGPHPVLSVVTPRRRH